jgi:hypothetical protein
MTETNKSTAAKRLIEAQKQAAKDAAKKAAIDAAKQVAQQQILDAATQSAVSTNQSAKLTCRDLDTLGQIEQIEIQDDTVGIDPGIIGRFAGTDQLLINPRGRIPPRIGNINIDTIRGIGETVRGSVVPTTEVQPELSDREDALNQLETIEEQNFQNIPAEFLTSPFLGLGRMTTTIDIENYADSYEKISKDYNIEKSKIKDRIRYYNSSFYILKQQSLNFLANTRDKKKYIRLRSSKIEQKGTLTSSSVENYKFSFDDDLRLLDKELASKFKKKFIFGGAFTGSILGQKKDNFNFQGLIEQKSNISDNAFIMQFPFENSEILNTLNLVGTSIVDFKESYNFYIEQYENIASSLNLSSKENVLPNLYVLNAIIEEKTNEKEILASMANLNTRIRSADKFMLNKTEKTIFGTKNNVGEYFDLFGSLHNSLAKEEPLVYDSFNNKMKNIIFLSDSTSKMVETNKKKYLFPMSVEIAIPADKTTNITRMLMDSELLDSFMLQIFNIYNSNGFESKDSAISERLYSQDINSDTQQNTVKSSYNTKRKNINFENISSILRSIKQQPVSPSGPDYVVIGDTTKYLKTNTQSMSFVNGLRNIIFNSKLNTFVRKNHRTYRDILEGKTCYNETVAFRVSKYNVGDTTPIQSYWVPNNPDLDFINLVDTQIKYEKEYTYKIFAYQFVLGNQITQSMSDKRTSDTEFGIDIRNLPEANLMEVEILSTSKMVTDTPPLSPEILFVPYFDVDNKMGIFLNSRAGEEKLKPINILSSDKQKTSTYKKNLDNTVLYKSDDVAKRFEIMRLDRKPNSYDDFASGFIKIAETDISSETIQKATAASFVDSVEPNKKYYYCFRVVDVHEKISNPTQVFELEILNEKGMVYPIIKNYDFAKPAYSNNIEMRRFIKIKPSSQHTFINKAESGIDTDTTAEQSLQKIKLGVSDVGVPWGKTFKMILTSKQTGKKVEFKFKFKYISE